MKIIKVGEDWKEPTFEHVRVKCSGCDSELEIESEDVMESNGEAFFECPVCFRQNKMTDENSDSGAMYWNWKGYMNKKKWENERVKKSILSDIERELDKAFLEDEVVMRSKAQQEVIERLIELEYAAKKCE